MKRFFIIVVASFVIFLATIGGGGYYFLSKINNNGPVADPGEGPNVNTPSAKNETVINALILGVDKSKTLSDVMILVSYNKKNNKVSMISIPRDTYVNVAGIKHHKINSVYGTGKNGVFLSMETVSNILQIPVHYYATIDFKGVERIIDILGGVKVNVPINMNYEDPTQDLYIHLKKGEQVLNGENAVKFVRFRSGYPDQDLGRIKAQQQFIQAVIEKLTGPKIIPKAFTLLNEMSKSIKTNMTEGEMAGYALKITEIKMDNVKMYTLPGIAKTLKGGGAYYIIDDVKLMEMMENIKRDMEMDENTAENTQAVTTSTSLNAAQPDKAMEKRSEITVEILNSTSKDGLAGGMKRDLEAMGYKVLRSGFMKELSFNTSRIIDRSGKKEAVQMIQKDTGINIVDSDIDKSYNCDITIIIGKDKINGGI